MSLNAIRDKLNDWGVGSHYRMERFSIMFLALMIGMVLTLGFSFNTYSTYRDIALDTKALYNTTMRMHKTNLQAQVVGVFASKDRTRAFVLTKFPDVSKISTNAKNYKLALAATEIPGNNTFLDSKPVGGIYVFGNSGYLGVYLVNEAKFKSQILTLGVCSQVDLAGRRNLGGVDKDKTTPTGGDSKFCKGNDLGIIYFNPGARDVYTLNVLNNKKTPTVQTLYNEAVLEPQLNALSKEIDAQLETMRVDLNQIKEFTTRLDANDRVQVADAPRLIAGDSIVGKPGKLELQSSTIVPGGYKFDWREKTDKPWVDRLIAQTKTPEMTTDQYFAQRLAETRTTTEEFSTKRTWTLKDGTEVSSLDNGTGTGQYVTLNNDIQRLISAWQQYYQDKTVFQRDLLGEWLHYEAQAKLIDGASSVNIGDKVLVTL